MDIDLTDFEALFRDSDEPVVHKQQIAALRRAVIGLAQDVDVLKQLLRERQVLDPADYKSLRIQRMVDDHNSAGIAPFRRYSYFPYLLNEEDYLRKHLSATETEIQNFQEQVAFVEQLT